MKDLTHSLTSIHSRNFRPLFLHSFTQMKLSFSPLKIVNRAKIEFWTLGQLKTKKIKINKNQIEKKRKGNIYLEPEALIPNDKIRNHYKESKIRITLLIEYLKARTLFEIRITPQARSIMSSLNHSCWFPYQDVYHIIAWSQNSATTSFNFLSSLKLLQL